MTIPPPPLDQARINLYATAASSNVKPVIYSGKLLRDYSSEDCLDPAEFNAQFKAATDKLLSSHPGYEIAFDPSEVIDKQGIELDATWTDSGIGAYEYWGSKGVDTAWEWELDETEGEVDIKWASPDFFDDLFISTTTTIGSDGPNEQTIDIAAMVKNLSIEVFEYDVRVKIENNPEEVAEITMRMFLFEATVQWKIA